tara:strand:+ start:331 stop:630 length:300 start_codon:yes stop_codon:yes gene_type:complete
MNTTVFTANQPSWFEAPPSIKIGADFLKLHQENLETRCKIGWDTCEVGGFILVPFNKSKSKPCIPERLKKQGWEFTVSKHNGTLYNGVHITGWVFRRIR